MTVLAQSAGSLDALIESVRSLPWAAHAIAVVGLSSGLMLWAMGRQVLRPIFCVLGALTGGGMGYFLLPTVSPPEAWGVPTPLLGLFLGGVAGSVAGFALYRFAVAISFAAVAGLAGILVSVTALHLAPQAQEATRSALDSARLHLTELDREHAAILAMPEAPTLASPDTLEHRLARDASQRITTFVEALATEFQTRWEGLPAQSRVIVMLSGFAGLGIGCLAGLLMPTRSAAAVTAGFGGAVWLPSAVWLTSLLQLPGRGLMDLSATAWLIAWGVVAIIVFTVQMTGSARKKKPEASKSAS